MYTYLTKHQERSGPLSEWRTQKIYFLICIIPCIFILIYVSSVNNVTWHYLLQCRYGGCDDATRKHDNAGVTAHPDIESGGHGEETRVRDKQRVQENVTIPQNISSSSEKPTVSPRNSTQVSIVIWTTPKIHGARLKRFKDIKTRMGEDSCSDGCNLEISGNQDLVDKADAVVFFMFINGYTRKELPKRKSEDQIWVYNQHEPPPNYMPKSHLNGLFNWTRTYRRDSDVYQPYYYKFPLKPPTESLSFGDHGTNLQKWMEGKTGLAAAVISRCKSESKREVVLKNLQDAGIPIDIYGGCGNNSLCPRNASDCNTFWADLAAKYKFFFAFENSFCSDYITEKFWRSLELGMVPVVLGRGNYLEEAPPNSYIDLRNFSSPEDLKNYLKYLDENPEEYSKYFEWKRLYGIHYNTDDFCEICKKLKEHKELMVLQESANRRPKEKHKSYRFGNNSHNVYKDIGKWWSSEPGHPDKPACITPQEMGLQKFLV